MAAFVDLATVCICGPAIQMLSWQYGKVADLNNEASTALQWSSFWMSFMHFVEFNLKKVYLTWFNPLGNGLGSHTSRPSYGLPILKNDSQSYCKYLMLDVPFVAAKAAFVLFLSSHIFPFLLQTPDLGIYIYNNHGILIHWLQ